jgi:hypothetical protein
MDIMSTYRYPLKNRYYVRRLRHLSEVGLCKWIQAVVCRRVDNKVPFCGRMLRGT